VIGTTPLDDHFSTSQVGFVNSQKRTGLCCKVARAGGIAPARATQAMDSLKLPTEVEECLERLEDQKEIRRYSKKKLLSDSVSLPVSWWRE
jgi:hypothetical protein